MLIKKRAVIPPEMKSRGLLCKLEGRGGRGGMKGVSGTKEKKVCEQEGGRGVVKGVKGAK